MTDLEALVVAAYVFADEYPVPARGGRRPLISDAELVALAVCQAAIASARANPADVGGAQLLLTMVADPDDENPGSLIEAGVDNVTIVRQ